MISFSRTNGIFAKGGKIEIAGRIEHYPAPGKVIPTSQKPVISSNFDWKNAELSFNTKLTGKNINTGNVSAFNPERTFTDAIKCWKRKLGQ